MRVSGERPASQGGAFRGTLGSGRWGCPSEAPEKVGKVEETEVLGRGLGGRRTGVGAGPRRGEKPRAWLVEVTGVRNAQAGNEMQLVKDIKGNGKHSSNMSWRREGMGGMRPFTGERRGGEVGGDGTGRWKSRA